MERMTADYLSLENQQLRNEKNIALKEDEIKFKKLLQNPDFLIKPKWHLKKKNIDFKYLDNPHNKINNNQDYTLYYIDIKELFKILDPIYMEKFPKGEIWIVNESKTTKILRNWNDDKKLIPLILIFNGTRKKMTIFDGNNRFAVLNYFNTKQIPIIILKNEDVDFIKIVNSNKIKKIE